MADKEKISSFQMTLLLVTTVGATGFLFLPAITAETTAQDGWISVLVPATLFGLTVAFVCTKLGSFFPDQTIVEYAPLLIGKVLGKVLGIFYFFTFVHLNAVIVREFGGLMVEAFMPETPLFVFNLIIVILAFLAVRHGIEVLARMNQFLVPLFVGVLGAVVLLTINDMELSRILPLLENGFKPILTGALGPSGFRAEVAVILMLYPYVNQPGEAAKSVYLAVILLALLLTAPTLAGMLVFGSDLNAHAAFPTLSLAKYISLGMFFERVEAFIIVVWVGGLTAKIGVFYLVSVLAAAQTLGIEKYRPLAFPVGILILVYSLTLFENSMEVVDYVASTFPPFSFTSYLVIPLMLLIVALIRQRGGKRK